MRIRRYRSALSIASALVLALALLAMPSPRAAMAAATTNVYAIEGGVTGTVNTASANLRGDPSMLYASVGKASRGTSFTVVGYAQPAAYPNGFFEIAYGSGRAFIAANLLDVTGLSLGGIISSPGYAYRSRSASNAQRLFSVAGTDSVTLKQRIGPWWQATINGQTGWLQSKIVQPSGTAAKSVDASQPKTSTGALALGMIPSSVTTPEGSVTVTVVGTDGARFVGWRQSAEGATYTDVAGFYDITSSKTFTATANGWYTACRIDADGKIQYTSIEISNVQSIPSGMRYGTPSGAAPYWGSDTLTLRVGESVQLYTPSSWGYASRVTWSTSNAGVASINANGIVRGIAPGIATISVSYDGRWSDSCVVTVVGPRGETASISLSPSSKRAAVNEVFTLTPVLSPSDLAYTSITWASTNNRVASVDQNGTVTCHESGYATISVAIITPGGRLYGATCDVMVGNPGGRW